MGAGSIICLFVRIWIANIKLKAYDDFLHALYIPQRDKSDTRFGDIVTLASGRLEQTGNNSFRFVEGLCTGYDCEPERVWALWQVQKIRHRDINRKFRYEMKFSVSPLRAESLSSNINIKRKAEFESHNNNNNNNKRSVLQRYIQRDGDYPHTFGKIISNNNDARFAERRFDLFNVESNFKQTTPLADKYRQATPIPQSTFMHGIFQPNPQQQQHHFPPLPEKLNIGEYIRDYTPKATPKIEHFPQKLNAVNRNYYPTLTTYRPIQQTNFPRPDIYPPPTSQYEAMKFPPHSQEVGVRAGVNNLATPVVTHHFHHHFYMPTTTNVENGIGSAEQPINKPTLAYKSVTTEATEPQYFSNYYNDGAKMGYQQREQPQTPKTTNLHTIETEVHRQKLVHVTPAPPLKRPLLYQMYEIPVDSKVPLLIYPAPVVEEEATAANNKPFVQSEPMSEEHIRYSEPDPLYLNLAHNPPIEIQSHELAAPQLEAPKVIHGSGATSRKATRPNSIAAQLPPPDDDQDISIPYEDEIQEANKPKHDLQQKSSQKDLHIAAKKKYKTQKLRTSTAASITTSSSTTEMELETTSKYPDTTTFRNPATTELDTTTNQLETIKTSASSVPTTNMPLTNSLPSATTALPSTTALDAADTLTFKPSNKHNFISTSTAMPSSMRSISRYRSKHARSTTTTTDPPISKWKPRRKHSSSSAERSYKTEEHTTQTPSTSSSIATTTTAISTPPPTTKTETHKHKKDASKHRRHEKQLASTVAPNSTKVDNDSLLVNANGTEVFDVITQKSVSKSVSIKIGENGKEIPVILGESNYAKNEVKPNE
ncbi:mucin-4 isoform X2 [Eurosta solidaginis]|uniref:mucin-4 isoform X2 n=1 Tax=Eurosta solidaginis TaxID=178769 RepID=UPI003530E46E